MSLLRILGKLKMIHVSLNEIIAKIEGKPDVPRSNKMSASDIATFFATSTRAENDATNKLRERVLKNICQPPAEWLADATYGTQWRTVHAEWLKAIATIAKDTAVPVYTSIQTVQKGGRGAHYDVEVHYMNGATCVATRNVEFKNGGLNISKLPQFLSLQAKFKMFPVTYDAFWFENYLDAYLACDPGITEAKPETYLKLVPGTTYSVHPFFQQLKERESINQTQKNAVVNQSIAAYLKRYGSTVDLALFAEKVRDTQTDKVYLLWHKGTFHMDSMRPAEMKDITYSSIKNGNVLELNAGGTAYHLLLRWRNHKGIMNPAWQISMKRS